jgi:two-component system, chemotaxis family, sensor kinase Cph1
MQQIIDFFKGLFETNLWPARWQCGSWSDFHGWLYIISDIMIWVAYFMIPVIILQYFTKKKPGILFHKAYILFAAFILLCGTTHFLDAVMFWVPMYRLNALVRFVTGVVSLITVYHLIKLLPVAFKQKTNLELEREIQKREEAERKLAEANKGLAAFAYVASHDLQEPLRKIKTFSTMLLNANEEKFDSKSLEYSNKILRSTEKMQQLVTDVLSLSSLSHPVNLVKTNVEDAVMRAKDDLEIKILEKGAAVSCESIPPVKGNEDYLYQLFLNLISNSLKFSDTKPVIKITGQKKDENVLIRVADNGIGMETGDTEKIFDPFIRLNGKSKYEGSGIGLSICKKIVDIHHGKIWVESTPGEGTTFLISLPAA